MNKILEARNINFKYKEDKIIENVNISINENEIVSILGESGSGKSTLLHILALIKEQYSGDIFFNDNKIINNKDKLNIRKNNFGFIYQQHKLMKDFNIVENIMIPNLLLKNNKKESLKKAEQLMERVNLPLSYSKRRIHELSGGEKQRVSIARALINNPKIIFADEPTGNLDQHNTESVFDLFKELIKDFNTSVLIVTHDLNLAEKTDKNYIMRNKNIYLKK